MAASLSSRPRRRIRGLMLIPLVDVIFLLLTFFMLASSIDPFSLLTLDEYQSRRSGGASASAAPQPVPDLVLSVANGAVLANGKPVALGEFPGRATELRTQGLETVVVFTRPEARVQDVVSVLDALKKAAFRSVIIRNSGGAAPGAGNAAGRG